VKPEMLKTLVLIRKQREDTALRALHAAAEILRAAEEQLVQRREKLQALVDEMASQSDLLRQAIDAGNALIEHIKQHRVRLEWLNDARLDALRAVDEAVDKVHAASLRVQELKKDYLRIKAKRDAAEAQIAQHRRQARALEETRAAVTAEELGALVNA
jgi:ABC-type transporter Mla subunit MlaD